MNLGEEPLSFVCCSLFCFLCGYCLRALFLVGGTQRCFFDNQTRFNLDREREALSTRLPDVPILRPFHSLFKKAERSSIFITDNFTSLTYMIKNNKRLSY